VTVCVIIVKLNESTSLAGLSPRRSCFSRIRGGQEGGGGGVELAAARDAGPG